MSPSVISALSLRPERRRSGKSRRSRCLEGRERTVVAFLADEGAPKLLGAQTLETFGLGVDPLGRRLVPVDAYLALA
jgi:hypothetical protein